MKIAIITDDGKTISQHFGRAAYYMVMSIEEGKISGRELRDKLGHKNFPGEHNEEHGAGHGLDPASHDRHVQMADAIADCQVLLCGGMGMGAYQSLLRLNIKPIITDMLDIEAAAQAYLTGSLPDQTDRLH
ncbi:MAG: NifB/NifX family molybdenum-iron cluster-binding protein [Anaerolineaceae bacterium]|nr:NifB/NifX family molybdenum-iron cluster-binding protein [Anaerolineaceae bacterium]